MKYSQNNEEKRILDYFGNFKGTFLDLGANDGKTLSNTFALAELGWKGVSVEPSEETFIKAVINYEGLKEDSYNVAIGTETKKMTFWESGSHLRKGDTSLLSTIVKSEIKRWKGTEEFTETETDVMSWADFYKSCRVKHFDFISIDCEGMDVEILKQMDLRKMKTKLLCIEWNRNHDVRKQIEKLITPAKLIHENAENLIYKTE
jgi:FkbM family methyltransferase